MQGSDIFISRFRKECKYQWGVFRGIVDWIIFVYLFIPAFIFVGYNYYRWWVEIPNWFDHVPIAFFYLILYFVCWNGRIRTFLEEADQLFFIQKRKLVLELKKRARNVYVFGYSLGILSIFVLLAPFLFHHYELTWFTILNLTFYFISFKACILVLKQYLDQIQSSWLKGIITIGIFIFVGLLEVLLTDWLSGNLPLLLLISSVIQFGLYYFYSDKRINKITTFSNDVLNDKEAKLKYIRLIFFFSENVEKDRKPRKRPSIFYRNSKRVFKKRTRERVIYELFIKVLLRNKVYWLQFFQIIWITIAGLYILPPIWIKLLIFLVFIFLIQSWVKVVFRRIMSNHYVAIVKEDDELRFVTERRVVNYFSFPVICIVGIVLLLIIL